MQTFAIGYRLESRAGAFEAGAHCVKLHTFFIDLD
jgi:hypothetical protein